MIKSIGTGIAAASTKPIAGHAPKAKRLQDPQQPDLVLKKEMEDFLQDPARSLDVRHGVVGGSFEQG